MSNIKMIFTVYDAFQAAIALLPIDKQQEAVGSLFDLMTEEKQVEFMTRLSKQMREKLNMYLTDEEAQQAKEKPTTDEDSIRRTE